jgi:phospholipase C
MRIAAKSSFVVLSDVALSLGSLTATAGWAQGSLPVFDHIVVIFQENRTPDNLFGGAISTTLCNGQDDFEPGVYIQNWGANKNASGGKTCFAAHPLGPDPINPGHFHGNFTDMWDSGHMDNACPKSTDFNCYAFVQKSDVQPYFDIATNYGFANYMFQTNEGPSFPAHQFIFSGTSAPIGINAQNNFHDWFAGDNPDDGNNFGTDTGCSGDPSSQDFENGINPGGHIFDSWYDPPGFSFSFPCYEHATLSDLLDQNHIGWKYYAPEEGSIWTAPTAISHLCGPLTPARRCSNFQPGGTYAGNVSFEGPNNTAPVFGDIGTCNLAAVSWVIPDMKWSDHPGASDNNGSGPDYVGNLVNAIGNSTCTNKSDGKSYWNSTAIIITWDDWGGWYDHVPPYEVLVNNPPMQNCSGFGCGYVSGFRVPMLVVSAYTGVLNQNGTYSGYVSGNTITQGGKVFPYIHDFGSILAFIENNFGIPIGSINAQNRYPFADNFAPDWQNGKNIPLSDFFGLTTPRTFVPITVSHPVSYFTNNSAGPQGPGDEGAEE